MIAKDLWLAIKDFDGIFKHLIPPTLSNCHFVIFKNYFFPPAKL